MAFIEVKTRNQIAVEYGFSTKTLQRKLSSHLWWLEPRCALTPGYQKLIYETIGWPSEVDATLYDGIPLPVTPDGEGPEEVGDIK